MLLFLKNALFTVIVPGTVAVLVPFRILSRRSYSFELRGPLQYLALLLLLLGTAVYLRCVWDFAVTGRGTPAPIDAPKVLVVRGLYRYVRNPMYVGVLLVVLGWSALFGSSALLIYAGSVGLFFHLFVVVVEEPILRRKFGESYEQYCSSVRRWLPGRSYERAT
ncbi:MAG TPA: isoprenylcysteine carboxylmethyltransferase family protein [Blastocatellia bacterium]|nr:isoprenylcysteine carboxylmethyltransferase family protein [Blastocatellia bacterium]